MRKTNFCCTALLHFPQILACLLVNQKWKNQREENYFLIELLTTRSQAPNRHFFVVRRLLGATAIKETKGSGIFQSANTSLHPLALLHVFHCTMRSVRTLLALASQCWAALTQWAARCHMWDHSGALHRVDLTHRTAGLCASALSSPTPPAHTEVCQWAKLSLESQLKTLTHRSSNSRSCCHTHTHTHRGWANMIW